jgi:hypothetical protein
MSDENFIPEEKKTNERCASASDDDFSTSDPQHIGLPPITRGSRHGGDISIQPSLASLALQDDAYRSVQVASRPQLSMRLESDFNPSMYVGKQADTSSSIDVAIQEEVVVFTDDEPPHPKFGYIEMHNHVRSDQKPSFILENAYAALKRLGVDCSVQAQKFKISADAYRAGAKLSFVVRLYTHDESCPNPRKAKGKYILEMQRRSGDSVYFADLYRSLVTHLEEQHVLSETVFTKQSSPVHPVHAAPFDIDVEQAGETIKCLKQMAASTFLDVKTEAFCCLAHFSQEPTLHDVLLEEGAFDLFCAALTESNENLRRCGVTGLANLAKSREPRCRELVRQGIVQRLVDSLCDSLRESRSTPQITREGSRLLLYVAQSVGREMIPQDPTNASELLNLLSCQSDELVRSNAHSLRQAIGV